MKRNITDYPLRCRRYEVFTHFKCVVCCEEIKKGEWYYSHVGYETHKDCVKLPNDTRNNHTDGGTRDG